MWSKTAYRVLLGTILHLKLAKLEIFQGMIVLFALWFEMSKY